MVEPEMDCLTACWYHRVRSTMGAQEVHLSTIRATEMWLSAHALVSHGARDSEKEDDCIVVLRRGVSKNIIYI